MKNNLNYYFILLLVLGFMEPSCIKGNDESSDFFLFIGELFNYLRYISILFSLLFIPGIIRHKISFILLLIFVYYFVLLTSSAINDCLDITIIKNSLKVLSLCIITEFFIKSNESMTFCKVVFHCLFFLVLINLLTILFFPEGFYIDEKGYHYNYLLGYKNDHINIFMPTLFFAGILNYFKYRSSNLFILSLLVVILLSCLLNKSTTSLVVIGLLFLLTVIFIRKKIPKWINLNIFFFTGIVVSVFFIMGVISGLLGDISASAAEITNKEGDSISERGLVWIDALIMVAAHPIIGNGVVKFNINSFYDFGHAHNQYLDILVIGGIILFSLFYFQIYVVSQKLKKIPIISLYNFILFIFISYFVEFLAEGRRNNIFWFVILVVTYNLPLIISKLVPEKSLR